jgi:hypothetical protein
VHIDDVVALYLLVFKLALSGADKNKSYGKFYFASARPLVWRDWSKTINKALMNKGTGLVDTLDPVRVTVADEPYLWYAFPWQFLWGNKLTREFQVLRNEHVARR